MREGDDNKRGLSPMIIMGLIVAVGAAATVGTYVTQIVSDNSPVNVVVLKLDTTSFKEKPEEPQAETDAGANSSVMNMLDELTASKDDIEILSLKPDAPEMPEVVVEAVKETQAEAAEPQEAPATDDATSTDVAALANSDTTDQADTQPVTDEVKPLKRPIKPLVIKNPVAESPSMMVQLAAFRNQDKAEEVAALLTEKHKERLQGLTLGIMQADTGSSGIFWRVTTEPLPTEDARALCDSMKRAGQDCIFRKVAMP